VSNCNPVSRKGMGKAFTHNEHPRWQTRWLHSVAGASDLNSGLPRSKPLSLVMVGNSKRDLREPSFAEKFHSLWAQVHRSHQTPTSGLPVDVQCAPSG
jgi:hypothetical protein